MDNAGMSTAPGLQQPSTSGGWLKLAPQTLSQSMAVSRSARVNPAGSTIDVSHFQGRQSDRELSHRID